MQLGLFFMPLHRPEKSWPVALDEDRETILHADAVGFSEVWMGEHFSSKAEQVPAPLMFFATLIDQAKNLRFGTGVAGLGHRHPVVLAAEAALFDHLSGGRLMLGVGPGGLRSDAELFGRPDMAERMKVVGESIDTILAMWQGDAPFEIDGEYWQATLSDEIWPSQGVGTMTKPLQQPHPPLAMALTSADGESVHTVARRSFIPISAGFVPIETVGGQWQTYRSVRDDLGLPVDPSIWRVCRSILITDSDAQADELLDDPDGSFAFYFRYLAGVREMPRLRREEAELSLSEINDQLSVPKMIDDCVIAGSVETVTAKLVDMVDRVGPFGTLLAVGHDWPADDPNGTAWKHTLTTLANVVGPVLTQHMPPL